MLYRHLYTYLENHTSARIVLLPGRQSVLRCAARAFQSRGLPSLDVQALFVSEMARYKPPIADQHAVIDSFARDHYIEHFQIASESIEMIGTLSLDDDIANAKALGRERAYDDVFSAPDGIVFTYASQPLGEGEVLRAVAALATYIVKDETRRLCVKLHPAQSQSLQEQIIGVLGDVFGEGRQGRWCVLRTEPFWSVMPMTDVLVSYFSNVCLMAPAFDVPVVTLPTDAAVPKTTFHMMGLAYEVTKLDEVGAVFDQVLKAKTHPAKNDPPYAYLAKNPHMARPNSLERLMRIVENMEPNV